MTQLRSEAEWVAFSDALKEVIFVIQSLRCMKISDKVLITARIKVSLSLLALRIQYMKGKSDLLCIINNKAFSLLLF